MDEEKQVSVSFTASGFPLSAFKEWTNDCKSNFGDCRWVKMMHDHQLAQVMPLMASFASKIEQLETAIKDLNIPPPQNEEEISVVKTLGGIENE